MFREWIGSLDKSESSQSCKFRYEWGAGRFSIGVEITNQICLGSKYMRQIFKYLHNFFQSWLDMSNVKIGARTSIGMTRYRSKDLYWHGQKYCYYLYFTHQAAPLVIPPCWANSFIGESQPGVEGLDILEIYCLTFWKYIV